MSFFRLAHIFLLSAFLLFPFAQEKILLFGLPLYLLEALLLGAFFFVALGFWREKKEIRIEIDRTLLLGLALFFLGALLSFLANPFSLTGLGMLKSWFAFPIALFFLLIFLPEKEKKLPPYLFSWIAGCFLLGLLSLQAFVSGEVTFDGRLSFPYASPNFLAAFISPGILLSFFFFLRDTSKNIFSFQRVIFSALFLFFSFLLFQTHSYGAWLGVFLSLFIFSMLFFWKEPKKLLVLFLGCGFLFAFAFFLEADTSKWQALLSFDERSSFSSRLMIWQSASRILGDHAFFGIGLGRFQEVYLEYQRYFPPYLEWAVPEPHNLFLALLLHTGLLGFFGFLILLSRSLFFLFQNFSLRERDFSESILLLSLFVFYLTYGLFDTPYFRNDFAFLFFALFAWCAMKKPLRSSRSDRSSYNA